MARGKITNEKTGRGYLSRAMGCHPDQVAERNDQLREHGIVGAEYQADGQLEITSRGKTGRAGVMKLNGWIDKDGGYGDHTG